MTKLKHMKLKQLVNSPEIQGWAIAVISFAPS